MWGPGGVVETGEQCSGCSGLNVFPKKICGSPHLGTCECDRIWKQGLCGYNGVVMRSYGWALTHYGWCPYRERRRPREDVHTRGECHVRSAAGVMWPQAEESQGQRTARPRKDCPPQVPVGTRPRQHLSFILLAQNQEAIPFC